MDILFDQGTPSPLRKDLVGHSVKTAFEMGWSDLNNGELLSAAETLFDLIITTDQNLRYQQNFSTRKIAVLVLPTTNWPRIERNKSIVIQAVNAIAPAAYFEIQLPWWMSGSLARTILTMHTPWALRRRGLARFYPAPSSSQPRV